jgi:hypothetical protein
MSRQKHDCNDYKNCPQQYTFTKQKPINANVLKIGFVGCWGTYCQTGEQETFKVKVKKGKVEEKISSDTYGSKDTVDLMENYYRYKKADAIILAGDNVYSKRPSDKNMKKYEECKKSQDEKCLKNLTYDIERQLDEGFEKCMANVNTRTFLIGVGNHDMETCDILNYQLNYRRINSKWFMPGISYQYVYQMNGFKVNFVFINTNLYDNEHCSEMSKGDIKSELDQQFGWMKHVLKERENDPENVWNVVIGHAPFMWNLHKDTQTLRTTFAEHMTSLKDDINLYCCADEHNQQFLQIPDYPTEIISGSGGAVLDDFHLIEKVVSFDLVKTLDEKFTLFGKKTFGFVDLEFTNLEIQISFINKDNTEIYKIDL